MVLQLYWIRQLFVLKPKHAGYQPIQGTDEREQQAADEAAAAALAYAPIYAFGNICIGAPSRANSV